MFHFQNSQLVGSPLPFSCRLYIEAMEELRQLGTLGLNTLTSKNASCRLFPQKRCALMSARASPSEFAALYCSDSPVSCCSVGSTATLGETSVRKSAVMSLMSLCLREGNPPQGQLKACSTVNFFLHVQQDGRCGSCHPYLSLMASLKAPLCRVKPCSDSGGTTSQCDAPFSPPKSIACCRLEGSLSCNLAAAFVCFCHCWALILFLMEVCSFGTLGHTTSYCRNRAVIRAEIR